MSEFITTAELIQKRHSGWSDAKCSLCGQPVTNAAKAYSLKIYGKPYCNSCQRVAEPIRGKEKQNWSGKKCEICDVLLTNAVYSFSKKYYKKPLCRVCQRGEEKKIDYI